MTSQSGTLPNRLAFIVKITHRTWGTESHK